MSIVVVGTGYWGKNLVRNFHDIGSLYGVCDTNIQALENMKNHYPTIKTYHDLQDVLTDPHVKGVVISTPVPSHYPLAKQVLNAGKHIFIEKPITLKYQEAVDLVHLAKTNQLKLIVGHVLLYHPAYIKMQELIEQGKIGSIKHIRCTRINLGKIRSNENVWWSLAPHDISLILKFLKNEPPLSCTASSPNPCQSGIEDTLYVDMNFASGVTAHIHASWLEPSKVHQTVIIGDKGMLCFTDTAKEDKLMLSQYIIHHQDPNVSIECTNNESIPYAEGQPLQQECQNFVNAINHNEEIISHGDLAVEIVKILETVDTIINEQHKKVLASY